MDHARVLLPGGAAELSQELRTRLRRSVAEFVRLSAELDAPESPRATQQITTKNRCAPAGTLALPAADEGGSAEEYVRDRLIPHIEQTLIPRLRERIVARKARAETGRRLEREVRQLRLEVTVTERQARTNTAAAQAHGWKPHLLH